MMHTGFKHIRILLAAAFFCGVGFAHAQISSKNDSIFKQAKLDIYENPGKVIRFGDSVYNDKRSSLDDKVDALMIISDAYSSKRDYQKSLKYFQIANELAKKNNDTRLQIKVLNRTAVRYQQTNVYDKAIQYLDECDRLIAAEPESSQKELRFTRATNLLVRGFIYKDQLNCDIAITYFDKGIAIYESINTNLKDANLSIGYYNKGNCYIQLNDFEKAKQSFFKSIALAHSVGANSLEAFADKGLAEVYRLEGSHAKSIEVLNGALAISKNVGDLVLNSGLYLTLANNYLALNNLPEYNKYNKLYLQTQAKLIESERRSTSDSIEEITAAHGQKTAGMQSRYFGMISVLAAVLLAVLFFIYRYQKKSLKSIEILNLEIKNIKSRLKSQ